MHHNVTGMTELSQTNKDGIWIAVDFDIKTKAINKKHICQPIQKTIVIPQCILHVTF